MTEQLNKWIIIPNIAELLLQNLQYEYSHWRCLNCPELTRTCAEYFNNSAYHLENSQEFHSELRAMYQQRP